MKYIDYTQTVHARDMGGVIRETELGFAISEMANSEADRITLLDETYSEIIHIFWEGERLAVQYVSKSSLLSRALWMAFAEVIIYSITEGQPNPPAKVLPNEQAIYGFAKP